MAEPSPCAVQNSRSSSSLATTITDLDEDTLAYCASYLSLHDICNVAVASKLLKRAAYSDSIWHRLFRERWPQKSVSGSLQTLGARDAYLTRERWPQKSVSGSLQTLGARDAYLTRHVGLHQFRFIDPLTLDFYTDAKPFDHVLFDKNNIFFSQGQFIHTIKIDGLMRGGDYRLSQNHNARITCMRLFSLVNTSLYRSEAQRKENVLVTSSCDHSIRLWWKNSCQRSFKGHNGPVTTLSDGLLGDSGGKLLASGGEDCTVRLWSLSSSGQRGQNALRATLYGHEKPLKLMSVAGHNSSLLATISTDSKIRVWDAASFAARSSCCVGMSHVCGPPVAMKCHESLLYVAAGSSVVAIDLRTMQKVMTAAIFQPRLFSFAMEPSESLICTGGVGKAILWDIRRSQSTSIPKSIAKLDGHIGPIMQLHMDPYKIITGGPEDFYVNSWETKTGKKTNSLRCHNKEDPNMSLGCSAIAVDGCWIATGSYVEGRGLLRLRDFSDATWPIVEDEEEDSKVGDSLKSKFWRTQSSGGNDSDSDDSDD